MREFHFYQVYRMASIVEELARDESSFIEIPWDEPRILECLSRPCKISLLHWYIYRSIYVEEARDYRKNYDLIPKDTIEDLQKAFSLYGIQIKPFQVFCKGSVPDEEIELGDRFYEWFESEFEAFESLWEQLTDEVFHLLFANRSFLLQFNSSLADYLETGDVKIPHSFFGGNGHLKRCSYIPSWLKKAIYFRDQGRCVLCQSDLSGLLSTDRRLHYDHIVPLYLWGTNDPSNFQLLCETCNLEKSKRPGSTSNKYPPWWEY